MANSTNQKTTLNLLSPICMDINDSVVRPFDSFNKKNAPYVGDQLSPFYIEQEKNTINSSVFYDTNGDKWEVNDYLYKNGEKVPGSPYFEQSFTRVKTPYTVLWTDDYSVVYKDNELAKDGYYHVWAERGDIKLEVTKTQSKWSFIKAFKIDSGDIYVIIQSKEAHEVKRYEVTGDALVLGDTLPMLDLGLNTWQKVIFNVGRIHHYRASIYGFSFIADEQERLEGVLGFNFIIVKDETECFLLDLSKITLTIQSEDEYSLTNNSYRLAFIEHLEREGLLFGVSLAYIGGLEDGESEKPFIFNGTCTITDITYSKTSATLKVKHNAVITTETPENDPDLSKKYHTSYEIHEGYYRRDCSYTFNEENIDYTTFSSLENDIGLQASGGNLIGDKLKREVPLMRELYNTATSHPKRPLGYVNYNNGYISGITSLNGNLITPWNSVKEVLVTSSENIYYTDTKNVQYTIKKNKNASIVDLYSDRYLLINADSGFNAYDIKSGRWYNWTIGYNGALTIGYMFKGAETFENTRITKLYHRVSLVSAAVNPSYEIKQAPFISAQFPPMLLNGLPDLSIGIFTRPSDPDLSELCNVRIPPIDVLDVGLEFYSTCDSTVPIYRGTLLEGGDVCVYDTELNGVAYPTGDILLTPSLLSTFIQSFNNHDYIVENGNGYPIIYSNNAPIFAYNLLSFVENIKDIFVIQNSTYMLFNNKIMGVQFNGTELQGTTIVADYTGMDFIGNTSETALFFSRLSRKIYTFTGDVVLRELRGANVIDKIYDSFFIPADNTIVMSCKEGNKDFVYFFGSDSFLKVENKKVNRCFFGDNKMILVSDDTTTKYSYFKQEGLKKLPIELQTGFFGLGNEQQSTIDCWYIRLFSDDESTGRIKVKQNVLTTIGVQTEIKEILLSPLNFDKLTHSYLLRYQPRYQTGVGFQLEIYSDFAIYEIVASYKVGAPQLTAPSQQI